MKKYLIMYALILIWLIAFPPVINKAVNGSFAFTGGTEESADKTTPESARTSKESVSSAFSRPETTSVTSSPVDPFRALAAEGEKIRLYEKETKKETDVSVELYTAHTAASFCEAYGLSLSKEALGALCVAVRTKALYENETKGKVECADLSFLSFSGESADEILNVVMSTAGEVVTYGGTVINALYHPSSPGRTESYENIYKKEIPYLTGVPSPDESSFALYYGRKELSSSEFRRIMETAFTGVKLSGDHTEWISDISFDNCLRCKYLVIGGEKISGSSVMKAFGLNSACIMISTAPDGFVFSTEGYGDGLGLSVMGAQIMAEQGNDRSGILTHYYSGASVKMR